MGLITKLKRGGAEIILRSTDYIIPSRCPPPLQNKNTMLMAYALLLTNKQTLEVQQNPEAQCLFKMAKMNAREGPNEKTKAATHTTESSFFTPFYSDLQRETDHVPWPTPGLLAPFQHTGTEKPCTSPACQPGMRFQHLCLQHCSVPQRKKRKRKEKQTHTSTALVLAL